MATRRDQYHQLIKEIYGAEKQLVEALPRVIRAVCNGTLKDAFRIQLGTARVHCGIVRAILNEMDLTLDSTVCVDMQGLIREADTIIQQKGEIDNDALDAALIAAAQAAKRYQIAQYTALREGASGLGLDNYARALGHILDDNLAASQRLSTIAGRT